MFVPERHFYWSAPCCQSHNQIKKKTHLSERLMFVTGSMAVLRNCAITDALLDFGHDLLIFLIFVLPALCLHVCLWWLRGAAPSRSLDLFDVPDDD